MSHLNNEQAVALLRKLGSDEKFHELFQKSPEAALAQLGLPPAFALCCTNVKLPPSATIRATELSLVRDLTAHSDLHVIGLNAS